MIILVLVGTSVQFVEAQRAGPPDAVHVAAPAADPGDRYTPRFEDAACPFEASPQLLEQVRCGYLTVPQNRAEPGGKQLRLAVAVARSTSSTPRPDPIVFLTGGPGTPSLQYVPARLSGRLDRGLWQQLGEDRDLIFFDPRGVGHSEPRFCPEVTEEFFRLQFLGIDAVERLQRQREVLARCAQVMASEGVDLSQYNSVASALDLRDLREALGYAVDVLRDPTLPVDDACITGLEPIRFATDVRVAPGVGRLASTLLSAGGSGLLPAAMGLPLLVLLGSVAGWPMASGVARLRRRERMVGTAFERRARWGAVAFALLALGFLLGLAWAIMRTAAENPVILLFGLPGWAAPLLVIPWILLLGSIALVATAALAWRRGAWSRWARIHFTLVAGASLALTALLFAWGIV
jgi:hypothetical protein